MSFLKCFFCLSIVLCKLGAGEFTVASYNSGGLSDYYDYLRAASMQKVMQERYTSEPEEMALNEEIQKLKLKIVFSKDLNERLKAEYEWNDKGYDELVQMLTKSPIELNSPNTSWYDKVEKTITRYDVRPVVILDQEVSLMLNNHFKDLSTIETKDFSLLIKDVHRTMARRIFHHHLKFDIICLQEADFLDISMFPDNYGLSLSETQYSLNGIAWNKDRFELVEVVGNIMDRAFAVKLRDLSSHKTVLVASGHITGCNPYYVDVNSMTGFKDSARGDLELETIVKLFDQQEADFKIIGMDSNVTSLHPRLNILKEANYNLDYQNFIDSTCSNPNQVLNTRIDWIVLKSQEFQNVSIVNIPVFSVGLNSIETNVSDHKPVAAKIIW